MKEEDGEKRCFCTTAASKELGIVVMATNLKQDAKTS